MLENVLFDSTKQEYTKVSVQDSSYIINICQLRLYRWMYLRWLMG